MSISIEVQGFSQAQAQLRTVANKLQDKTELYRRIGVRLNQWIDQNFEAQGLEHRWAPLAASTVFGRRQAGVGAKILQNNGMLRASHTYKVFPDRVVVGFPEGSVAEYLHFGTSPYTIRPKNPDGWLVFPMPPGGGASLVRRRAGTPRVGLVKAREAAQQGLKVPAGRGDIQSLAFAKEVHHPGLKARPLLPSQSLAEDLANQVVQEYLTEGTQ